MGPLLPTFLSRFRRAWRRPPRAEPEPRLAQFRAEVEAACQARDRAGLDALAGRQAALGLRDEDVELELELIDGTRGLIELAAASANTGLPVVQTPHRVAGSDTCHLIAPALQAGGELTRAGKLFLTDRRAFYACATVVAVPWPDVATIRREARDVLFERAGGRVGLRVRCNTFGDALRAVFVAERILSDRRRSGGP